MIPTSVVLGIQRIQFAERNFALRHLSVVLLQKLMQNAHARVEIDNRIKTKELVEFLIAKRHDRLPRRFQLRECGEISPHRVARQSGRCAYLKLGHALCVKPYYMLDFTLRDLWVCHDNAVNEKNSVVLNFSPSCPPISDIYFTLAQVVSLQQNQVVTLPRVFVVTIRGISTSTGGQFVAECGGYYTRIIQITSFGISILTTTLIAVKRQPMPEGHQ